MLSLITVIIVIASGSHNDGGSDGDGGGGGVIVLTVCAQSQPQICLVIFNHLWLILLGFEEPKLFALFPP